MTLDPGSDRYVWRAPAVPATVRDEAGKAARAFRRAMEPAERGVMLEWLQRLGVLVAGKITVAEAKQKLAAYALDLRYPALCFTDNTRVAAAKKFPFYPSFAELCAFFDETLIAPRLKLYRLEEVAKAKDEPKPDPGPKWADMTPAERDEHRAMMDGFRTAMRQPGPRPIETTLRKIQRQLTDEEREAALARIGAPLKRDDGAQPI